MRQLDAWAVLGPGGFCGWWWSVSGWVEEMTGTCLGYGAVESPGRRDAATA
jgi:hypothetical protein